jgi:hypothetical protein
MESRYLPKFIISANRLNKVVAEIYSFGNPNTVFLSDVNNLSELDISEKFVELFKTIKNCFPHIN